MESFDCKFYFPNGRELIHKILDYQLQLGVILYQICGDQNLLYIRLPNYDKAFTIAEISEDRAAAWLEEIEDKFF